MKKPSYSIGAISLIKKEIKTKITRIHLFTPVVMFRMRCVFTFVTLMMIKGFIVWMLRMLDNKCALV